VEPSYDLQQRGFDDPVVQALVAELQQEFVVRYGGPDSTPMDARQIDPPSGAFFVALLAGQPVGMGGWRRRPDVVAPGGTSAARAVAGRTARIRRVASAALMHAANVHESQSLR